MGAALQDICSAAGEGDDAGGEGEKKEGEVAAFEAERDWSLGDESYDEDGWNRETDGGQD